MVALVNSMEGTNGAAITTSNSAGPDQLTAVAVAGAGSSWTWDNAHAHSGTTAAKVIQASGVASSGQLSWLNPTGGYPSGGLAQVFGRAYWYFTAAPSVAVIRLMSGSQGASHAGHLQFNVAGTLRMVDSGGTQLAVSTGNIPLNQWVRIELEYTNVVGTTGDMTARLYSGANLETNTADTGFTLTATGASVLGLITAMRIGPAATTTQTTTWTAWVDDWAVSDAGPPGPLVTSEKTPPRNRARFRAANW